MTKEEEYKLIERTCKYDAYHKVVMWGRNIDSEIEGTVSWYAKEKMEGHREWLVKQKYKYDYVWGFILNDRAYYE